MIRYPANREAVAQDLMPQGDPVLTLFAKEESAKSAPQDVLYISSLSLHHFRNYENARIEVAAGPVVLTGHNGAGKTNVLEAISLFTPGRGIRRAKLEDINQHPLPNPPPCGEREFLIPSPACGGGLGRGWAIAANINGMQGDVKIGTGRDPESLDGEKRLVKIDGKTVRSQAELARHLSVLWLTPQMEHLFQESASAGRKFFDRLVYGFDAEHASRVAEYEYAMRERNRLLAQGGYDNAWLDALELTMAETGCAIAQARVESAANINHAILASPLSFPKAEISMGGFAEQKCAQGEPAIAIEEALKTLWRNSRFQDAGAGRTLAGLHKSELMVLHRAKNAPASACSTGEQKAMLLSIILAQARASGLWRGSVPILLLDEVVTHLDSRRRLELFEEICQIGAQTWMTGTDENAFAELQGKAQFFTIENGNIKNGTP